MYDRDISGHWKDHGVNTEVVLVSKNMFLKWMCKMCK